MKKLMLIALGLAFVALFGACKGETKEGTDPQPEVAPIPGEVEQAAPANSVDATLDEFDKVVDQFVDINKKLKSGDVSVATELAKVGNKITDVNDKIMKSMAEMTPDQIARYQEIANKLNELQK